MLDQQIESAANKLVQFLQDLTDNIQTFFTNDSDKNTLLEVFQLRSHYARQLGSLFDMLINKMIDNYKSKITSDRFETLNIDPVKIWQRIQSYVDKLDLLFQTSSEEDLHLIVKQIRAINGFFYNLLLQVKNAEFLKADHTRTLSRNLNNEIDHLAERLIHLKPAYLENSIYNSDIATPESPKPKAATDTYLFQSAAVQHKNTTDESTKHYSNNNNHMNETTVSMCQQPPVSTKQTSPVTPTVMGAHINPAMNTNYHPCKMMNIPQAWTMTNNRGIGRGCIPIRPCYQTNGTMNSFPQRPTIASGCPQTVAYPLCGNKAMGCGTGSGKAYTPPPLCFPTPVVYTPEMETLFSAGGIIYARKSGNTWVAENLGTLVETLKEIGETIAMGDHCEILVRKTGDLFVRRKRGHRKKLLQQTLAKTSSHNATLARGNNAYEDSTIAREQSNSDASEDDRRGSATSTLKKHFRASKRA